MNGKLRMKVAVLFGGTTAERDVSIASGTEVIKALREAGHQVVAVDTARGVLGGQDEHDMLTSGVASVAPELAKLDMLSTGDVSALTRDPQFSNVEVVFLALHGGTGEGGQLQALLDLVGIPYTGSGMLGSAMAMDKDISKQIVKLAGVPTPEWLMAPVEPREAVERLGLPLVVKPSKQGSSVGLTVVKHLEEIDEAVEEAVRFDDEVLLEQFIAGRELTVPILADAALPVGEIISQHEIFDYECKYQPGMSEEIFPAELEVGLAARAQDLAIRSHRALKLGGFSRVDFRLDAENRLWFLEVNTLPGMTAASLFPKAARAAGISFPELCTLLCRLALQEHARARRV